MTTASAGNVSAQRPPRARPNLAWLRLGVSLSDPPRDDLAELDLETADLHRFSVRLARLVLCREGSIVSGHDWRPRGEMRAMLHFARRYAASAEDATPHKPAIRNFVAWPDRPTLNQRELAGLAHVLSVESLSLPSWCRQVLDERAEPGHVDERLARVFALSALRTRLAEETNARVCVGGKLSDYGGRYPGALEELAMALAKEQPLYLVGWAGGLTREVIGLLLTGETTRLLKAASEYEDTKARKSLQQAFQGVRARVTKATPPAQLDWLPRPAHPAEWSLEELLSYVHSQGHQFSKAYNGLDKEENRELWESTSRESALDLILRGLSRLDPARPRPSRGGKRSPTAVSKRRPGSKRARRSP